MKNGKQTKVYHPNARFLNIVFNKQRRNVAYQLRRHGFTWKLVGYYLGVTQERGRQMALAEEFRLSRPFASRDHLSVIRSIAETVVLIEGLGRIANLPIEPPRRSRAVGLVNTFISPRRK